MKTVNKLLLFLSYWIPAGISNMEGELKIPRDVCLSCRPLCWRWGDKSRFIIAISRNWRRRY